MVPKRDDARQRKQGNRSDKRRCRKTLSDRRHLPGTKDLYATGRNITRRTVLRWVEKTTRHDSSKFNDEMPDSPEQMRRRAALKESAIRWAKFHGGL